MSQRPECDLVGPIRLVSSPCDDYALLDFGNGRRLERMGRWLLDRPAPQALAIKPASSDWQPDWIYDGPRAAAGEWQALSRPAIAHSAAAADASWPLQVDGQTLHLRLAGGGQVGLYPEHISCWRWLRATLSNAPPASAMLNLFAASGGASVAAAHSGAAVTHVDALHSAIGLARSNLASAAPEANGARIIREDVGQFVARAQRQQRHYPLIVLDPPSFGRGPKGQTWSLTRDLPGIISSLTTLLGPRPLGLWLSTHTPDWEPQRLRELLHQAILESLHDKLPAAQLQAFSLGVRSIDGRILSSGNAATANWPPA